MKMVKPEIQIIDVMKLISSCVFGVLGGGRLGMSVASALRVAWNVGFPLLVKNELLTQGDVSRLHF
jgi:hypothetical protein